MKKYISLAVILVTVLAVILCFTACKGNTDGGSVTESTQNSQPVNNGYSAEVTETSLKVYKDDVFVQELTYPSEKLNDLVLAFAKNHVSFKDMNFDGAEDICLTISTREVGFNYCCWIYDSAKGEFVYNETLSSFTSITLDATAKQVVSTEQNDDGETVYVVYAWDNGELKKVESVDELPETAKDNVLGSSSSNQTTSREPAGSAGTTQNNNSQNNSSEDEVEIETKPAGSGNGIALSPDQYGETWY